VADYTYVTIHQRPRVPVPALETLKSEFEAPATLEALREMTGVEVTEMAFAPVLTAWGRGTFLEAHTDAGPKTRPTRLVISVSLTEAWSSDYGGTTVWAWTNEEPLRLVPTSNQAVLFAPSERTRHWVEPVASHAPERARYTWTLYFA
jgi:Rps23 Pro-64 3,4-dihydroxylase Tpa1-like proline 4-hydroxylase